MSVRLRFSFPLTLALLLWPTPAYPQSVQVEPRQPSNLLLCSWNIKWFRDTGRDLTRLAQVIAHFDICGIIELQSDRVLQDLAAAMNPCPFDRKYKSPNGANSLQLGGLDRPRPLRRNFLLGLPFDNEVQGLS